MAHRPTIVPAARLRLSGKPAVSGVPNIQGRKTMSDSVYKVIELVGTHPDSWDKAAAGAIARASKSLRDLRVAEVTEQDLVIENGVVKAYRTKLKVSFKFED